MGAEGYQCLEWHQGEGEVRVLLEFPKKVEEEGHIVRGVREMLLGMLQEYLAEKNRSIDDRKCNTSQLVAEGGKGCIKKP